MASEDEATFAVELTHWRTVRGLSKTALAGRLNVDPSYISHLESGREHGSAQLARRADQVLDAGGALWKAWQAPASDTTAEAADAPPTAELIVLEDDASLTFDGTHFHLRMRRVLQNNGTDPVTRYLIRIAVDRYPGEPERSNALYRAHPLTWDELNLAAHCGPDPMTWTVKHDRDAFKEVWLEFANPRTRFPLYPGQTAEITYSYSVSAEQWGPWFQRAVRLPTRHLNVTLTFPAAAEPTVWGTTTSMSAQVAPLRTPPQRTDDCDLTVFSWSTTDPELHARYRLEWRLNTPEDQENESMSAPTASRAMVGAGIVQEGDPILTRPARYFDLPGEADEAKHVIDELMAAIHRVRSLHTFGKGMGIAAPQLGIARSAAVVLPPDPGTEPIVLLNAAITEASEEQDQQYEGCLSFFDVRGLVPRPLHLVVVHSGLDGTPRLTRFRHGEARLVAHEIDHLDGILYHTRMRTGTTPIPVEEYRGTGHRWDYG